MEIECKLKREGGTYVELGGRTYHFKENAKLAHIADIDNEEHLARFLSIPESFRLYKGGEGFDPAKAQPVARSETTSPALPTFSPSGPMGSDVHPLDFNIHGTNYTINQIINLAMTSAGLTEGQWNLQSADARALAIDAELDRLHSDEPSSEVDELAKLIQSESATISSEEGKAMFGQPIVQHDEKPAEQSLIKGDQVKQAIDVGTDEREALVVEYEKKFGHKPHHRTSIESIKNKLAED